MQEKILELGKQGKSYNEIVAELGCSKSLVTYYLGDNQKEKHRKRQAKRRKNDPLLQQYQNFIHKKKNQSKIYTERILKVDQILRGKTNEFNRSRRYKQHQRKNRKKS